MTKILLFFLLSVECLAFSHAHFIQNIRDFLLENQSKHLVKVHVPNEAPKRMNQPSLENTNSMSPYPEENNFAALESSELLDESSMGTLKSNSEEDTDSNEEITEYSLSPTFFISTSSITFGPSIIQMVNIISSIQTISFHNFFNNKISTSVDMMLSDDAIAANKQGFIPCNQIHYLRGTSFKKTTTDYSLYDKSDDEDEDDQSNNNYYYDYDYDAYYGDNSYYSNDIPNVQDGERNDEKDLVVNEK
mmetsp:Transcript_11893/g.17832  ORF Transcript_11893/g.17832 Transcript_11893/m.17832 type:complete len:247 (-) Transcript_11893:39-779(-)|eukprot:CAMPEP_0170076962 /NCGR_PEP_ID=MMETSP0019_2-20121128/13868_1 /TAXON_ID=98059 /ORGANISM="Dinobryon sp., Strain UTEXLB2267" /LENGTH=246 /DNA_ID=CAMNT_0010288993 /DNA_START=7 /DNA_END=747 /DNA_ORIENTATION=-